jgi:hypothetical protein
MSLSDISSDCLTVVYEYCVPYTMVSWVRERIEKEVQRIPDILDGLSVNPNAVGYLTKHPELISWYHLSKNPNAIHILETNVDKLEWSWGISTNPNAFHLYLQHHETDTMAPDYLPWYWLCKNTRAVNWIHINYPQYIDWSSLSSNPNALWLLEQYPDRIDWNELCYNPNPKAVEWVQHNIHRVSRIGTSSGGWGGLSGNPSAVHLLEEYSERLDKECLCMNPKAIPLLLQHPEMIHWGWLSLNPSAMDLLETHPEQVNIGYLIENPSIFQPDRSQMSEWIGLW